MFVADSMITLFRKTLLRLKSAGLACLVLCIASLAHGSVFETDSTVVVSSLQVIDDDYFLFADKLIVDGTITGDLFAFVVKEQINGTIGRSAHVIAETCIHDGLIEGGLRAVVKDLVVNGIVSGNLIAFGNDLSIESGAVVQKDLTLMGSKLHVAGTVKGDVSVWGERVLLSGHVGGNLAIRGERIRISPPAVILGNVTWETKERSDLVIDSGVTIVGTQTWNELKEESAEADESAAWLGSIVLTGASLLAAFLFGLLLIWLFRPYVEEAVRTVRSELATSMAVGVVGSLGTGVCILVLIVSLLFMAIGAIVLSSDTAIVGVILLILSTVLLPLAGFAALCGVIVFYAGAILVSPVVGHLLLSKGGSVATTLSGTTLFVGLVLLSLLFLIPYLGALIFLLVSIAGMGAIMIAIRRISRLSVKNGAEGPSPAAQLPTL